MMDRYFPQDRVILAINLASMRYAGAREAISDVLMNHGCAHLLQLVLVSSAKVREILHHGKLPPPEFFRPAVAAELARAMQVQS